MASIETTALTPGASDGSISTVEDHVIPRSTSIGAEGTVPNGAGRFPSQRGHCGQFGPVGALARATWEVVQHAGWVTGV